jgi:predicted transcriptional regulator
MRRCIFMSKNLSLKLQDEIFEETERVLRKVKRPRNAYINEAIHFYNKLIARKLLKNRLIRESNIVAADSMAVLEEFEKFEDGLPGENNGN